MLWMLAIQMRFIKRRRVVSILRDESTMDPSNASILCCSGPNLPSKIQATSQAQSDGSNNACRASASEQL